MEVSKHLIPWMEGSKADVCMLQNDRELWSEDMVVKILRRHGGINLNIQDAQSFIKDYLSVLCETI